VPLGFLTLVVVSLLTPRVQRASERAAQV
jgi:hypothetical protein